MSAYEEMIRETATAGRPVVRRARRQQVVHAGRRRRGRDRRPGRARSAISHGGQGQAEGARRDPVGARSRKRSSRSDRLVEPGRQARIEPQRAVEPLRRGGRDRRRGVADERGDLAEPGGRPCARAAWINAPRATAAAGPPSANRAEGVGRDVERLRDGPSEAVQRHRRDRGRRRPRCEASGRARSSRRGPRPTSPCGRAPTSGDGRRNRVCPGPFRRRRTRDDGGARRWCRSGPSTASVRRKPGAVEVAEIAPKLE
mgnify:CR=1 FL=1